MQPAGRKKYQKYRARNYCLLLFFVRSRIFLSVTRQQHSEDSWNLQDGTVDDLKEAVVANLEHRGVMGKLRAKVITGSKRAREHRFLLVVTHPTRRG